MNADVEHRLLSAAIAALTPQQRANWQRLWHDHARPAHPDLNFDSWLQLITASALRAAERQLKEHDY